MDRLLREFLVEAKLVETIDQAMKMMIRGNVLRKSGGNWKVVSNKEAPLLPGKWKVRRKGVFTITVVGGVEGLVLASSATEAGVRFENGRQVS